MFKILDGRSTFYQWDLDRKLIVSDPKVNEVHFCNQTDNQALIVNVYSEGGRRIADVPNILLQTACNIIAFSYCDDCYTKQSSTFKVTPRPKPSDYVYTETEVKRWEALEQRVNTTLDGVTAAEEKRTVSENARVEAETERAAAETARIEAENERDAKFSQFISEGNVIVSELSGYEGTIHDHERRITNLEHHISQDYFFTDDSVAHRKVVPSGACPYAQINSVCGMTYKSKNLVNIPDMLNNTIGTKYINVNFKSNVYIGADIVETPTTNAWIIQLSYKSGSTQYLYPNHLTKQGGYKFSITADNPVIGLTYRKIAATDGRYKNFMISYGNAKVPYEPYYDGLRDTKVTAIRSHGANLIPYPYRVTDKEQNGMTFKVQDDGGIKVSGTPTDYADFTICDKHEISLFPKIFTIGMQGTFENVAVDFVISDSNFTKIHSASINQGETVTIDLSNYPGAVYFRYTVKRRYENKAASGVVYPMVNEGSALLPYKPYRELIEYPLPEAITSLDGWGEGVAEHPNTYDFESGTYTKKCETIVIDGDALPVKQVDLYNNGLYYAILTPSLCGTKDTSCLINSHFTSDRAVELGNSYITGDRNQTLVMVHPDQSLTTVEQWNAWLREQYNNGTPVMVTYVLAEPITEHVPTNFDNILEVEAGGTLEFVNEYGYEVPNSITYLQKEGSI